MTAYNEIPDSDIDPDSPLTTNLVTWLRDNWIAGFEGASGAPVMQASWQDGGVQNLSGNNNVSWTGIPSWVKNILVQIRQASTASTATGYIQVGDGSFVTTGYLGGTGATLSTGSATASAQTVGFLGQAFEASGFVNGQLLISRLDPATDRWTCNGNFHNKGLNENSWSVSGSIDLSGDLDRVRVDLASSTFDGGQANILYS